MWLAMVNYPIFIVCEVVMSTNSPANILLIDIYCEIK